MPLNSLSQLEIHVNTFRNVYEIIITDIMYKGNEASKEYSLCMQLGYIFGINFAIGRGVLSGGHVERTLLKSVLFMKSGYE